MIEGHVIASVYKIGRAAAERAALICPKAVQIEHRPRTVWPRQVVRIGSATMAVASDRAALHR